MEQNNNYGEVYVEHQNENKNKIEIPNLKSIACILVGWIGLSVVATIISFIAVLFIGDVENITPLEETKLLGWINFAAYAVIFISLFAILGLPIMKKICAQFLDINKIGKGFLYGGILLGSSIAYNMIVIILYPEFGGSNENQNAVVDMISTMPVVSFFSVVLFAPITEEITYRLCLTGTIAKKNKILGIVLSSVLFGLIHSAFIDFSFLEMTQAQIIDELLALPSYIISGVVMALAYTNEDSIATSITAHMTNNLIAFAQSFIPMEFVITRLF